MSAPQTNLEKQKRRHRGPLLGIIGVVVFALALLFWLTMRTAEQGQPVERNAPQVDSRTGEEVAPQPIDPTGTTDTSIVPQDGTAPAAEPEPVDPAPVAPAEPTTTP